MSRNEFKRITPAEVVRGEDGFWDHPEFPVSGNSHQCRKARRVIMRKVRSWAGEVKA